MTTVAEIMTRGVRTLGPDDTVVQAARLMDELNVGVIPVVQGGKLVGMVTDRDIVVRGVALGGGLEGTKLSAVMSGNVRCALEGDDVEKVLAEMAEAQIRRLPVVDGAQKLVGIVSLGDIAVRSPDDEGEVGTSLGDISAPSEPDRAGGAQQQSQSQSQMQS